MKENFSPKIWNEMVDKAAAILYGRPYYGLDDNYPDAMSDIAGKPLEDYPELIDDDAVDMIVEELILDENCTNPGYD